MSDKIYIITQGSYSDCHVNNYVNTEEEAIRVCHALNNKKAKYCDEYEYEELEKFTGEVKQTELYKGHRFTLYSTGDETHESWIKTESIQSIIKGDKSGYYYGIINEPDEEKARKIFYDKLAEYKAREEGI